MHGKESYCGKLRAAVLLAQLLLGCDAGFLRDGRSGLLDGDRLLVRLLLTRIGHILIRQLERIQNILEETCLSGIRAFRIQQCAERDRRHVLR